MKARGFTLLEVLVALAIIGIALTALIKVIGQSADTSTAVEQRIRARWVAQNHIALARATQAFPDLGETLGQATLNGATFNWRQRVSETPNRNFRKLEISVSFNGDVLSEFSAVLRRPI
ncbi:MAG: type secretion system protein GspI [Pseudomonadota bacterium]